MRRHDPDGIRTTRNQLGLNRLKRHSTVEKIRSGHGDVLAANRKLYDIVCSGTVERPDPLGCVARANVDTASVHSRSTRRRPVAGVELGTETVSCAWRACVIVVSWRGYPRNPGCVQNLPSCLSNAILARS